MGTSAHVVGGAYRRDLASDAKPRRLSLYAFAQCHGGLERGVEAAREGREVTRAGGDVIVVGSGGGFGMAQVPERLDAELVDCRGKVLRGRLHIAQRGWDRGRVSARRGCGPECRD